MMLPVPDSKLLRAFAESGDEGAFAELVKRRVDFVYAAARRQVGGDAHRAEDITQEVFVKLARNAPQLIEHPALLGWLHTTTRCAAIDVIRSEQQRKRREEASHDMHANEASEDVNWEKLRPVLDEALSALNEPDREVVLARYFDHQAFVQIAEERGISENAAQKRADRALDKLHALLGRRGITSTTTALAGIFATQGMIAAPVGMAASVTAAALSTATAISGGTAAGLITFMSINKTSVGVLAALAAVVTLNVTQQQANAQLHQNYLAFVDQKQHAALVAAESRRVANEVSAESIRAQEASELARFKAQADDLRKRISRRSSAIAKGENVRIGGKVIFPDTPPEEKLELMYKNSRSMPMRTWQTLHSLGMDLADKRKGNLVDTDMVALMLSFDDAGRTKADAFMAALPHDLRARYRDPEQLVAQVFDQWLWKGDRPQGYGGTDPGDVYVQGDSTRAYSYWRVTRASGRTETIRHPFKRFDDGWRYGPLGVTDVEEMLALLDPQTGLPKSNGEEAAR
ncbi:MAG: RNA polymerase sigma factor [Opitutaceae bacterium]